MTLSINDMPEALASLRDSVAAILREAFDDVAADAPPEVARRLHQIAERVIAEVQTGISGTGDDDTSGG